jgi:hypothetical protein
MLRNICCSSATGCWKPEPEVASRVVGCYTTCTYHLSGPPIAFSIIASVVVHSLVDAKHFTG